MTREAEVDKNRAKIFDLLTLIGLLLIYLSPTRSRLALPK